MRLNRTFPNQVVPIGVMVLAAFQVRRELQMSFAPLIEQFLYSPAKATFSICVDSFKHEEDRSYLEDRSTNKCSDATTCKDLVLEFRGRPNQRKPYEEGIDHLWSA